MGSTKKKSKAPLIIALVVLLVGGLGFGVWYFVLRDTAPAAVDSVEGAEARQEAIDGADTGALDSVEGAWMVDTSIGVFNDACLTEVCTGSFAGFRIDEVLTGVGDKTVVGRTPGVSGSMSVAGTQITTAEFLIDMTGLITDSSSRNGQLRSQSIETDRFPEASFVLRAPIELGAVPDDGESVTVDADGDLTIHGVTQAVTIPLTAERNGAVIVVFGTLDPVQLADYDIDPPSAPVVASVDDHAVLEVQLFFTKAS